MVIKSRAQIEPIQGRRPRPATMRLRAAMLERRQSTAHEHDLKSRAQKHEAAATDLEGTGRRPTPSSELGRSTGAACVPMLGMWRLSAPPPPPARSPARPTPPLPKALPPIARAAAAPAAAPAASPPRRRQRRFRSSPATVAPE